MRNIALIDADSIVWSSSYGREQESQIDEYIDLKINDILSDTGCEYFKLFVAGENNFRYLIRKDYKANRVGKEKPDMYYYAKKRIIDHYDAFICNGVEADDVIVSTYNKLKANGHNPIICSIDKDYKIKPVDIYVWERHIKDVVLPSKFVSISESEAVFNFFVMMLTGDAADGIKVCSGIGDVKAKKLLSNKSNYGMLRVLVKTYRSYYGSGRWRQRMIEAYHLLNLIDDGIVTPSNFQFRLV